MKVKREVFVEICDFCEKQKSTVCELCGKDLCSKHALRIDMLYTSSTSPVVFSGDNIFGAICPNHLTPDAREQYDKKILKLKEAK